MNIYIIFYICLWALNGGDLFFIFFFLQVLKRRKELNDECELLRRQNTEINHLLRQYSNDENSDGLI